MKGLENRARNVAELMDDPECDPQKLARTYGQFGLLNRIVGRWPMIYRTLLRPALNPSGPNSLLDIGFGGGDVSRRIAGWAARDGLSLNVTAIDPDPRAHEFASTKWGPGVDFQATTSGALVAQGRTFDVVISNHVLHHLDDDLHAFLSDSVALASRLVVHSDIERSTGAYGAFSVLALPLAAQSFAHADGLTSIRRSYRHGELAADAGPGWHVRRAHPSRLILTHDRSRLGTDVRARGRMATQK